MHRLPLLARVDGSGTMQYNLNDQFSGLGMRTAMRIFSIFILILCSTTHYVSLVKAGELKIGLPIPENSRQWDIAIEVADEIAQSTTGTLEIKLIPVKSTGLDVGSEVIAGKLDGGLVGLQDFDKFNLGQDAYAYTIPFMFSSVDQIDFVRERMDSKILDKLSDGPYETVAFMEQAFAYVMSTKNLSNQDDWNKRKILMQEGNQFSERLGIVLRLIKLRTAAIPGENVIEELKEGRIDTVIVPPAVAVLKRWHRTLRNIYNVPIVYMYGIWIVRDESLQHLASKERQFVHNYIALLSKRFKKMIRKQEIEVWNVFNNWEINTIVPSPSMEEVWKEWGKVVRDNLDSEYRPTEAIEKEISKYLLDFNDDNGKK